MGGRGRTAGHVVGELVAQHDRDRKREAFLRRTKGEAAAAAFSHAAWERRTSEEPGGWRHEERAKVAALRDAASSYRNAAKVEVDPAKRDGLLRRAKSADAFARKFTARLNQ